LGLIYTPWQKERFAEIGRRFRWVNAEYLKKPINEAFG
jgi:hypothetical protein